MFIQYAVTVGDNLWNALYSYLKSIGNNDRIDGIYEENSQKFAVLQNNSDNKYYRINFSFEGETFEADAALIDITDSYTPAVEPQFALADVESFETEYAKKKEEEKEKEEDSDEESKEPAEKKEEKGEDKGAEDDDKEEKDPKEDEEKKKKKFNLEEVEEYVDLKAKFDDLQNRYSALETELSELREFKNGIDREKK